jgi:hypothetical protein
VHNIDLTGQDVPWPAIGQLESLEEVINTLTNHSRKCAGRLINLLWTRTQLSLWNCGLGGPIEAAALCRLRGLQVLAVSKNALRGTVPECIAELPLAWLWLEDNRFHGPVSEYSSLGQYLKNVDSLNFGQNRWAPLLRAEKAVLEAVAEPLGVMAAETEDWSGHAWDFGYSYDWEWMMVPEIWHLTAERAVSHRYWSAGISFEGFKVALPFDFPRRGEVDDTAGVGSDGDLALGSFDNLKSRVHKKKSEGGRQESEWGKGYIGCFRDQKIDTGGVWGDSEVSTPPGPEEVSTHHPRGVTSGTQRTNFIFMGDCDPHTQCGDRRQCASVCAAYRYMGLSWANMCLCGNTFGQWGPANGCGEMGRLCASSAWTDHSVQVGSNMVGTCLNMNAIFDLSTWSMEDAGEVVSEVPDQVTCWASLPAFVPDRHIISEAPDTMAASSQGADYLSGRFCPGWAKFITAAACDPVQKDCSGDDANGSAIFDGGGDMYDLGNVLVTSLMGDCSSDSHDCPLGSLRYRGDFAPVETGCFGPGGHYQMVKLDGVWVFFSQNVGNMPLDFFVVGNLGSDGSGTVTEYIFDSTPYVGFVKRECGAGDDPSVNHMIIVDGVGGRPVHSCNQATNSICNGANSDIDDDAVSGVAPGSPILYLLFSSEGGRCIKEDTHRAIFDAAVRCLWVEDPFEAEHQGREVGSQPVIEVAVDNLEHIVFGGTAPYAGWSHTSNPRHITGPGGFATALQFEGAQWLQLGESGVKVAQVVKMDNCRSDICGDGSRWCCAPGDEVQSCREEGYTAAHGGTFGASWGSCPSENAIYQCCVTECDWTLDCYVQIDNMRLPSLGEEGALLASANGAVHVGAAELFRLLPTLSDGWHRITIQVEHSLQHENRTLLVDGVVEVPASEWYYNEASGCPTNFFAVGGLPDGSAPFPLPIHSLRLYSGILEHTDMSGSVNTDVFAPLRYHAENSRWLELSRGPDAVVITWDILGFDVTVHEQVRVKIEPTGGLTLRGANASRLWDRAVASAAVMTDRRDMTIWNSAASHGAQRLRINYMESDPCYDLWEGVECSMSNWPVGTDNCAQRLECAALGWDPESAGSIRVCGTSSLLMGGKVACVHESSYEGAVGLCQEMGGRLCTPTELEEGEGSPSSCGYDSVLAWSWAEGGRDECPANNQSLGASGRPAAWYSFSKIAAGVYHEIQLWAEDKSSYSYSINTDIMDMHGEIVHIAEPPTLHRRTGAVMLRWNITQGQGPYYVRVTSTDLESAFSMVAVVPPLYQWAVENVNAWSHNHRADDSTTLHMTSSITSVDLGFIFPFFGVSYDRVWVTSAGYVAFEMPLLQHFDGLHGAHSAIIVAGGEYNLNPAKATVTVLNPSESQLEVAWHAPLYNSSKFTDVAVRLKSDGTIEILWSRIELPSGGSLQYGLLAKPTFETVAQTRTDGLANIKASRVVVGTEGRSLVLPCSDVHFDLTMGVFYGADAGEGLDLTGDFVYAVNTGGSELRVGDVLFSADNPTDSDNITINNRIKGLTLLYGPGGHRCDEACAAETHPQFGGDTDDANLATVMASQRGDYPINDQAKPLTIIMDKLEPGCMYSLQLMYYSGGLYHVHDVRIDGVTIQKHFFQELWGDVGRFEPGVARKGTFLRYDKLVQSSTMTVELGFCDSINTGLDSTSDSAFVTWMRSSMYKHCVALFGFTLEKVNPSDRYVPNTNAVVLVGDAHVKLPEFVLGASLAFSAWIKIGTLSSTGEEVDSITTGVYSELEGITLFNSFQDTSCGNSDACRNAVGDTLDRNGWFALGNDVAAERPTDLWAPGVVFDHATSALFWEAGRQNWFFVTFVVSDLGINVYSGGQLLGVGALEAPLPRMRRSNNYVGAGHRPPFRNKGGGINLAVADFRLYDRTLTAAEVVFLFKPEDARCCVAGGIKSVFGLGDIDLTPHAMAVATTGIPAAVTIAAQDMVSGISSSTAGSTACSEHQVESGREIDICGDVHSVPDSQGSISDGMGPYKSSADCSIILAGYRGVRYSLIFDEFELAIGDFLSVFDGTDANAPVLVSLTFSSVKIGALPQTVTSSGNALYIHFTSDDVGQGAGFRVTFASNGDPLEYWKPSVVATALSFGVPTPPMTIRSQQTACLSNVFLSVQCCADSELSCANARVTEIGLNKHKLRGSLSNELGSLSALRSLKLHENFL